MASITVRDLDESVKRALRVRAAENGRSMESEVRAILTSAVSATGSADNESGLGSRIVRLFGEDHGVDLELPERTDPATAADLA